MKKYLLSHLPVIPAAYFFISFLFINSIHGQIFRINGNISTDSVPVSYASVTFIDESNSSKTFTAIADIAGNYRLDLNTGISENHVIPETIELAQNYPNPFASETQIPYKLKNQSDVHIKVYNILGQEVRTFNIGLKSNGIHGIKWDGKNNSGIKVTPGVYLYQLQAGNEAQVKKMIYAGGNAIPVIPFSSINSLKTERIEKIESIALNKSYTCLIESNSNTNPRIFTKEIKGLKINSDSTLNIIVAKESDSYFPLNIGNEWTFQYTYFDEWIGHDTTMFLNFKIVTSKNVNGETYYGFDHAMPFFPDYFVMPSLDSIFVRQNEKGDIMLLVDSNEYPYFIFSNGLQSNLVCSKIKDVDYCYNIISISDSVNTPAGEFIKCVNYFNYFPQVTDTDYNTWFSPGFGPVIFYYPYLEVTYFLISINIQK